MTSSAELLLAEQLRQAGIPFEREYRFHERRWRFDFVSWRPGMVGSARGSERRHPRVHEWVEDEAIAVEIEGGSYTGGHKRGKAYESDCDKHNEATRLGWKVYRFTPAHVEDGRALAVIQQALRLKEAAA